MVISISISKLRASKNPLNLVPYIIRDRNDVYVFTGCNDDINTMNVLCFYEIKEMNVCPDFDW